MSLNLSSSEALFEEILDGDRVITDELVSLLLSNLRLVEVPISLISSCTRLSYLSMSFNKLLDISPLSSLRTLVLLDVSHNKISSLQVVQDLPLLATLKCQNNCISDLQPLSHANSLHELWLSNNLIEWPQLIYLQTLSKLKSLVLHSNAASSKAKVGEFIAGLCPSLSLLDGMCVHMFTIALRLP